MTTFDESAITILRYMLENGIVLENEISQEKLRELTGINAQDFGFADGYLWREGYITGNFADAPAYKFYGSSAATRWITAKGVQYIKGEIAKREPISLDAERVLKFLISDIKDNEFLTQDEILTGVNISPEQYRQACQQLADFDFVVIFGDYNDEFPALKPLKAGRQAVHRNFLLLQPSPSVHTGAIFNAPVTGGNIQAIANAEYSQIQQNVSALSRKELHDEIEKTLEKLLEQVTEQLTLQQKAAYTQIAAEFQKEVSQPQPDPGKLRKLLAGLGLLSDVGGAIDFGQKVFTFIALASPYIMLLGQYIAQLLQSSTR